MDILRNNLLPIYQENFWFQQDNAPVHVSNFTKDSMKSNQIKTLNWPPLRSELNPIVNLWGLFVRKVYENNKQFDTIEQLKQKIERSWDELNLDDMNKII